MRSAGTPGSRPSTLTFPSLGGSAVASRRSSVVFVGAVGAEQPDDAGFQVQGLDALLARVAPNERPAPRRVIEAVGIVTSTAGAGAGGA